MALQSPAVAPEMALPQTTSPGEAHLGRKRSAGTTRLQSLSEGLEKQLAKQADTLSQADLHPAYRDSERLLDALQDTKRARAFDPKNRPVSAMAMLK